MNLYGVLGRYIPAFGRIVGRMQYDLFHAYTVDAHTLFVVSNLRRFALERYDHEFPKLAQIFRALPKPELAYLAAIFHDIAKGRGGDHSELGAVDAEAFCLEQGLSPYDARLVAWLVRHHLKLSVTAQKQDISDPQVVNAFALRGRRPGAARLPLRAHRRGRARDQPEAVERLESDALRRAVRARQAGAAPRTRVAARPRTAHRRDAGAGARATRRRRRRRGRLRARLGDAHRRLFPAALRCRGGLAHRADRGARARRREPSRRRCRAPGPRRRDSRARLYARPAPQLRAGDRGPRPAGSQHPGRPHHADRGRRQPRRLPRARGHRPAHHGPRAHGRHRAPARARACRAARAGARR